MTEKQAAYVQARARGLTPPKAYHVAYPAAGPGVGTKKAYHLERNPLVRAALVAAKGMDVHQAIKVAGTKDAAGLVAAGIISKEIADAGATRAEKRRVLKAIIMNRKLPARDRIAAIQTDNLMTGDNKPVRFEGEITLHGIMMSLQSTTGLPHPNEIFELNGEQPPAP